jgi:hypothetical protein
VISAEKAKNMYKSVLIVVFKTISALMIIFGIIITFCVLADKVFGLEWGYPWWSFIFCFVYIGMAIGIYRSVPSFVGYIDRLRGNPGRRDGPN